jgi:hypothetical protein
VEHQLRRVEQIHARLFGDLGGVAEPARRRPIKRRTERAKRAVVPRATIEIDNEQRRAERGRRTQCPDARGLAEIIVDQAPLALVVRGFRHRCDRSAISRRLPRVCWTSPRGLR